MKFSNADLHTLIEASQLSDSERAVFLTQQLSQKSSDELVQLFTAFFDLSELFTKACVEAIEVHVLANTDIYPDRMNINVPSLEGALHGQLLAQKAPNKSVLCKGCAYRCGTFANFSAYTLTDVGEALEQDKIFYCHEGIDEARNDFSKAKPCKGWAQHVKKGGAA